MDPMIEPEHEHPEHGDSAALVDEAGYHGLMSGLESSGAEDLHLSAFDDKGGAGLDAAQGDRAGSDAHLAESLGLDPSQLGIERTTPPDHGAADFYDGRPSEDRRGETAQDHPPMSAGSGISGMTAQPAGLLHQQAESSGQPAAPPDTAPGTGSGHAGPGSVEGHYATTAPAQTSEAQVKGAGQAPGPTGSSGGTGSVAAGPAPDASPGGNDQLQAHGQQELSKKQDTQETSQLLNDIAKTEHEINMGIINNIR